jgi:hypothetical protein
VRGRESEGQRGTEREREYVASIYVYAYNHIQIDRSVHTCMYVNIHTSYSGTASNVGFSMHALPFFMMNCSHLHMITYDRFTAS